jgi:outer membrane receptor for ferrienterochelin and colicin
MLNLTVEGVEAEVKGRVGPVSAFANYTLQVPMESVTDAKFYVDGALKSIPRHSANAGVTYKPFSFLSANVTGLWTGRVQAPLATNPQNDIGQHVVLNGTLALEDVVKGTRFAATVYNALDDTYQLAGNAGSTGGMPPTVQAGRWFLVTGEYTF